MDKIMIEQAVNDLITKSPHLSLATVHDSRPWVCEVHFAYDDDLNLYFISRLSSRHSQEINSNSYVAGNIVKQHPLSEAPNGLYFEGRVEELSSPIREDIERYVTALNRDVDQVTQQLAEDRRMYKITVKSWAVFGNIDGSGHKKYNLERGSL